MDIKFLQIEKNKTDHVSKLKTNQPVARKSQAISQLFETFNSFVPMNFLSLKIISCWYVYKNIFNCVFYWKTLE